jgi:hypothetical protein
MHGSLERRAESDRGVVGDLYDEDFCGFASLNGMTDTDCPRKQPPPAAQTARSSARLLGPTTGLLFRSSATPK